MSYLCKSKHLGGDCLQQFSLSSCFEEYTDRWSLELDVLDALDVRRCTVQCTVGGWGLGTVQLQEQTEKLSHNTYIHSALSSRTLAESTKAQSDSSDSNYYDLLQKY